jgi:4-hydroxybenzoyl-CoA thioesterase
MSSLRATASHALPVRVYIEDTDAGGIVYYVNYLKYFERARSELMRDMGVPRAALPGTGCQFVVHSMQVEYLRPAVLDDALLAEARVESAGRASIRFAQRVLRGAEELCRGSVTIACIDAATGKPRALPDGLRAALAESSTTEMESTA